MTLTAVLPSAWYLDMQTHPTNESADILVTAPQGQPLLVVEVKRHTLDPNVREQLAKYSQAIVADFVMSVDPQQITVAPTQNGKPRWEQAIILPTDSILRHYTDVPSFDEIEGFYLESLVEAWLQDFSLSWKSALPPGYEELDRIGLASLLRNSETHAQGLP